MSSVSAKTPPHWGGKPQPEANSGIPVAMPINCERPPSLEALVAKYVHETMTQKENVAKETWEEADDFEEDDPDTLDLSKYEFVNLQDDFDPKYDPFAHVETPSQTPQEAPQEEISTTDGPNHQSKEETPSGASE